MTKEEFLKTFPSLIKPYNPNPDFLKQLGNVSLLMIVGPSGVGKTTLIQRSGIHFVPSDTTREPRIGEREGIDFYFRRDLEQVIEDMKSGRFVQVAIGSGGDFYATRASSFPAAGWATLPIVSSVIPIFRGLGFKKTVTAFITPTTYQEWLWRMKAHPATVEQRVKRLVEGRRSYEFALADSQTHIILNDNLDLASKQVKDLVEGRVDAEREARGREAVKSILKSLN